MSFWGAAQETLIDGAAGAVGAFAPTGIAEAGAAAIHGIGAAVNSAEGNDAQAAIEGAGAGAAAIPSVGRYAGALDISQAVNNAAVAYDNSQGGDAETTGDGVAGWFK